MSWLDSAADLHSVVGARSSSRSSWNPMPTRSTSFRDKLKTYGYDYGSHNIGWGDLAAGRVPPAVGTTKPVVDEPWKDPPAKFDVSYPTSFGQSRLPVHAPVDAKQTEGLGNLPSNLFGAVSDVASNRNLGNAVPWFMERVAVLAHQALDPVRDSKVPIVSEAASLPLTGLDAFANGVTAASNAIGPAMEAFPNYVRDGQLHDRSKVYRALLQGGTVDWGSLPMSGPIENPIETFGSLFHALSPVQTIWSLDDRLNNRQDMSRIRGSVNVQAQALKDFTDVLRSSVDPQQRLSAEQGMALLKEAIDIPMSVKLALEANPNATDEDIQKALDAAPEGRAWSYRGGPEATALNMATPLLFYLAEAKGFGNVAGGVKAAGAKAYMNPMSLGTGVDTAASLLGAGARGLGTGLTAAAKLQSYAFKAGVSTTILTTLADAVARTAGNQEAVDWFDKANRTTIFSDNPNVQLVTSFSVNPLDGTLGAAKGVLRVGHGLADVTLGATLGKRLSVLHDQPTWLNEMTRRVYNLKDDKEAVAWMDDPTHLNRERMLEHVLQLGLEAHVLTLPTAERAHIGALPALERMTYLANTYMKQGLDLLEKDPDAVVKAYQKRTAEHHGYAGGYDPAVAAVNDLDYRLATEKTMELRGDLDAVVSYREALPPEAQTMARDFLDTWSAADGTVAVRGLESLNHLIEKFPILKDFWTGKEIPGVDGARVPKETVTRIIDEATAHYQSLEQTNPIRAHTGRDPVLRPTSPTLARDIADAVGTNLDTINAIQKMDPAGAELARQFLVERKVLDKAAADALTPEVAIDTASAYLTTRIAPWEKTGAAVEGAEKQLARYRQAAAAERAAGRDGARLDMEAAKYAKIISDAGDPLRTFAETVAKVDGPRIAPDLMARAARKVDARIRLGVIENLRTELGKIGDWGLQLHDLELVRVGADGQLTWTTTALGKPPDALVRAFIAFKTANQQVWKSIPGELSRRRESVRVLTNKAAQWTEDLTQMTDEQVWAQMFDSPGFVAHLRRDESAIAAQYVEAVKALEAQRPANLREAHAWERTRTTAVDPTGQPLNMTNAQALRALASRRYDTHAPIPGGAAFADTLEQAALPRGVTGQSLAQIAEAMGVEPKVALQKLAEMKRSYHDALDGRTEANLRRTSESLKKPEHLEAVRQAEENAAVRDLVFDPEYEAWGLPESIAKVAEITSNPTDRAMWSALRPLFEGDDAVAAGVENVAQRLGVTADDILGDPAFADALKAELVPAGFVAPDGLVRASEAIDQAILNGDNLNVAELARKVADPKPTRVTGTQKPTITVRVAAPGETLSGKWVHYTTEENAASIIGSGRFAPEGRQGIGGATTGPDGFPQGSVFLGQHGYRFMEYMGSEFQYRHGDAPMVVLVVDLPANLKVLEVHYGSQGGVDLATLPADLRDTVEAAGIGGRKEATARAAKASGYDAVRYNTEEMVVFEPPPAAAAAKASAVALAKRIPKLRKSYKYDGELRRQGADLASAPDEVILADPRNALGLDAMSVINYGALGTRPQTLAGVIEVLRQIENRHLGGLGTEMAAEAQKVARQILDSAIGKAKAEIRYEAGTTGTIGRGVVGDKGDLAESVTRLLKYDDSNPLATLQYGLKKRAKASVVFEWAAVPGLAEELMTKNFKPWEERLWTAETRKLYNYVFGPTSNSAIRTATQVRFMELAGAQGVDSAFAKDVFDVWHQESATSGTFRVTRNASKTIGMEVTGNPMYADVWNIPNGRLNVLIHGSKERNLTGLIDDYAKRGLIDAATAEAYKKVDFADLFRTSGSFTKRQLGKVPGKLGEDMAALYGVAAHNKAVTTLYFTFRFALDIRFHAQNYFEAQILGAGMAGFRKREAAFGEFGMDSNYLHHLESNEGVLANTGAPLTQSRHATAYDTFLRMKGDPLREATKGLATEDGMLLEGVLKRMGYDDAVTKDMVEGIKANPDDFIRELDAWHAKMLKNTNAAEDGAVIDAEIAAAMAENPEIAEVLTRLGEVNKGTWDDIRKVMYGNPDRSRAERLLNSYWLYWPLSYQIKATKWFANVLFDSVGGLKTNASGAWLFNEMATTHQQQLATNPEYQAWFEKHKSLVFTAQMLFPVSFDKVGVSLNPFLRNAFFGGSSDVTNIGPIYTLTGLVPDFASENYVDLYPTFGDYLMRSTRQKPTKAQQQEVTDKYGAPAP